MEREAMDAWGAILTLGGFGGLLMLGWYVSDRMEGDRE